MPQSVLSTTQNAAITERLNLLIEQMTEVKMALKEIGDNLTALRTRYEGEHAKLVEQVASLSRKVDDQDKTIECIDGKIDDVEKRLAPLSFQSKLISMIGAALLTLIVGLVWAILTHTVTIAP